MRRSVALFLILGLFSLGARMSAASGYAVGDAAAPLGAPDSKGIVRSLAEYSGKWVFLDFCAAWCGPCQYMGSVSQPLQDTFDADAGAPPFQYVTALVQSTVNGAPSAAPDAATWRSRFGLTTVPVLHANGAAGDALANWFAAASFGAFPTGVVIDPAGVVRAIDVGYRTPGQIVQQISALAGVGGPPDPPAPPTPAFLSSAGLEISSSSGGSSSEQSPQSIAGVQLQYFGFAPIPGLAHPVATLSTSVSAGVETMDFAVFDYDLETGNSSDIALASPWKTQAYSMAWSDGFPRVRTGGAGVHLSLLYLSGGDLAEFPTSVIVPDTFAVNGVRFGVAQLSAVSGRPAHVVGYKLGGLKVAIDTTAQQVATLSVAPAPVRAQVALATPWPNPTRGAVMLAWSLARPGDCAVEVLDMAGRRVKLLAAGVRAAGTQQLRWDLRDAAGSPVAPGLYLVRVTSGRQSRARRLVVLE